MDIRRGVGQQIVDSIGAKEVVNGYNNRKTQANGMGCLAAMYIAANKEGCGNLYVTVAGTSDSWQEYDYFVYDKGGVVNVRIESSYRGELYDGPATAAGLEIATAKGNEED